MSTQLISKSFPGSVFRASGFNPRSLGMAFGRTKRYVLLCALTVFSLMPIIGCGFSGGQALFMMGFGRGKMVEAKFRFTEQPVLIFVDDYMERITWPAAKFDLTDQLAQELLRKEGAKKIIPFETIQRLQQSNPDFERKSVRQIGEIAGAEQVLWLEIQQFFVSEEIFESSEAAFITATVKVIDVLEKKSRSKVRLWPKGMEGYPVRASLPSSDVQRLKTRDAISKELTLEFSEKIAKLFYDHRLGDFEKEE